MPTYEYACRDCGEHLEVVQSFKDDALTVCPSCDGDLRKVFSAAGIIFKGSGWHIKDYASKSSGGSSTSASPGGSSDDSSGGSSDSDGSSGKSSDKPAGKSSDSGKSSGKSSRGSGDSSSSGGGSTDAKSA